MTARTRVAGALCVLLTVPASLGAQGGVPDTVTGVVFDSLAREPLAGAIVVGRPHVAAAIADERGRFELVSDSLVQQLVVHHPSLDLMGLDGIGAARPDPRGPWRDVSLATPSFATIWRAVCEGPMPVEQSGSPTRGVLVGSARLAIARTGADGAALPATGPVLVAGAAVEVAWRSPLDGRTGSRRALTDSLGTWALCDVPVATELALAATSVEAVSGVVRLAPDARRVRRIDLLLGRTGDRLGGIVRGRIVDETGFPVAGARVTVEGVETASATADRWGEFRLAAVPLGSHMLSAQAVGHTPVAQAIDVTATEASPVTVTLARVVPLEQVRDGQRVAIPVRVTDSVPSAGAAFGGGRGASLDPAVSLVANAAEWRAARGLVPWLSGLPWIRARYVLRGGNAVAGGDPTEWKVDLRGAGNCRVHIFVDGRSTSIDRLNAVPFHEVAGAEAYASRAVAPDRFAKAASGRECAVVALWTEEGLQR